MQKESIGETIRHLRRERQLTQKMLAADICAQSVISRAENNEELPNVVVLHQICERLNITVDQLLLSQATDIHQRSEKFQRIHHYFVRQKYKEMMLILSEPEFLDSLFLETDLQLYYYYLGSCEFFVENQHASAIQSLRKGLSYTYNQDKVFVSTTEIRILSCLGYVLKSSGQLRQATKELEKSYTFLQKLPHERKTFELIKVCYHYGELLYEQEKYGESLAVINEGLRLVEHFCSYYYLEELYELNSLVLEKCQQKTAAVKMRELAQQVGKISPFKSRE
ncbi:helix-turn-helix domain-containing protein [Enterococcus sp. LJL98]